MFLTLNYLSNNKVCRVDMIMGEPESKVLFCVDFIDGGLLV